MTNLTLAAATALIIDDAHDDSEENPSTIAGVDVNLKVASQNVFKVKAINKLEDNVYAILKHASTSPLMAYTV